MRRRGFAAIIGIGKSTPLASNDCIDLPLQYLNLLLWAAEPVEFPDFASSARNHRESI